MVPPVFSVTEAILAQSIMGHLRSSGQYDAVVAMQLSLGLGESSLGPELLFLQQLTLEGRWEDVIAYLLPLKRFLTRYEQVKRMRGSARSR